jgi:CDP-paratose 2-epimerase
VRVLVTGGCGFLGSHVCELFRVRGDEVVALDNMTKLELARTGYEAEAARDHNRKLLEAMGVRLLREDVRDLEAVLDAASGCGFIAHTAAQPALTIGLEEPLLDLSTNVVGTVHALEAARRHRIPLASCATIHVYGNWLNDELREDATRYRHERGAIGEEAPTMQGHLTPLHASKASAEHYVRVYACAYGLRAASFRLTGIYGPRQLGGEDHGWVANFAIRNAIGWPITIFGTGKQVRDILFARDAAQAFADFCARGEAGVYNVGGGPEHAISLVECLRLIEAASGRPSQLRFEPGRFGDLRWFVCDVRRAREGFGWRPRVRPDEGVREIVAWVERNRELFAGAAA